MNEFTSQLQAGSEFVQNQAPLVAQEYLNVCFYSNLFGLIFWLICFVVVSWCIVFVEVEYSPYNSTGELFTLLRWSGFLLSFVCSWICAYGLLCVVVAPKYVILSKFLEVL